MPNVRVFLLGAPQIERGGSAIEVDTRKAIALLAYLILTGQPQTRDTLAALLYPETDQSRARAALRRTLSALRQAIGEEHLEISREMLQASPGPDLWVDVLSFKDLLQACQDHPHIQPESCAVCLPKLQEAAALYRGDFMAGFTLRDSANFDDWQFYEADHLRLEFSTVLERLGRITAAQGNFEGALEYARRWLAMDTLQEAAHRLVMRIYAWSGRRNAALRQYRECVRILDSELGVPPLEETTELYRAILDERLPPPIESPFQPQPGQPVVTAQRDGSTTQPFIGRAHEWAALSQTYQNITEHGHILLLQGEAGIGKTRLATEFIAAQEQENARTIRARCFPGEKNLAFAPLITGLQTALAQASTSLPWWESIAPYHLADAARLLPELRTLHEGDQASIEGPGAQSRFFEAVCQVISALLKGGKPGILFIDDIHWADEGTIELLTYFTRRLGNRRVLLLFTGQPAIIQASPNLSRLLTETHRLGGPGSPILTTLEPTRFTLDEIQLLVQETNPSASMSDIPSQLFAISEGLPFFVLEYVEMLKKISPDEVQAPWKMPPGVRSLLENRYHSLDETSRQLLQTAAAIGRSFSFDIVREVSGRSEEETVQSLEILLQSGVIQEYEDTSGRLHSPKYDFSHPQMRSLVYENTSLARNRLLHRRIASILSARAARQDDRSAAAQIARHYQLGGQEEEAAWHFVRAGEYARSLYANETALEHFQSALMLGHPDTDRLHMATGDLLTMMGDYPAALRSYEKAASMSQPDRLPDIEHKIGLLHMRLGDWHLAESHFQFALDLLNPGSRMETRAVIFADWSMAAHQQGSTAQAGEYAAHALTFARESGDQQALAQALNISGILALHSGEAVNAVSNFEESLAIAIRLADITIQIAAQNNLAYARAAHGDHGGSLVLVEQALTLCQQVGDRHREAALLNHIADLHHTLGHPRQALDYLRQAVTIFVEIGVEQGEFKPEIWKLTEW